MSEQFTRWDPVDQLQSEEDMAMYLDACLEEDPGDGSVVRAALNDIARAQGMTQLAKATGITREGLYKALAPTGNPEFSTILKVIKALKMTHREDLIPLLVPAEGRIAVQRSARRAEAADVTIHGDGTLVGEYALTVADSALAAADTVLMYDWDTLEMARGVVPDWRP